MFSFFFFNKHTTITSGKIYNSIKIYLFFTAPSYHHIVIQVARLKKGGKWKGQLEREKIGIGIGIGIGMEHPISVVTEIDLLLQTKGKAY